MDYVVSPRPELVEKFPEVLGSLREIEEFVDINFSKRSISTGKGNKSLGVLWFLGARAVKVYRSIALLCEQGYGTEAMILVRSLMETYLSIAYIAKEDSEFRAKAYGEYEIVVKNSLARKLSKYSGSLEGMIPDNWEERVAELAEQSKGKILENSYKGGDSPGGLKWTGMSIPVLASSLGDHDFYIYYHKTSEHVHVFPSVASDFQHENTSNAVRWSAGPSENAITETSLLACTYMMKILWVMDSKFDFHLNSALVELDNSIKSKLSKFLES